MKWKIVRFTALLLGMIMLLMIAVKVLELTPSARIFLDAELVLAAILSAGLGLFLLDALSDLSGGIFEVFKTQFSEGEYRPRYIRNATSEQSDITIDILATINEMSQTLHAVEQSANKAQIAAEQATQQAEAALQEIKNTQDHPGKPWIGNEFYPVMARQVGSVLDLSRDPENRQIRGRG